MEFINDIKKFLSDSFLPLALESRGKMLMLNFFFSSSSVNATVASTLLSKATKDISILGYYLCLIKETYNQKASDWFLRAASGLK